MNEALQHAKNSPYDGRAPVDSAHLAAIGVLSDLSDRSGLDHQLGDLPLATRIEIVDALTEVIRDAFDVVVKVETEETPVEARLLELLAHKDAELEEAHSEIHQLSRTLELGVDWMLHKRVTTPNPELPVPRAEVRLVSEDFGAREWELVLVHKQRDGEQWRVPVGYSKSSGGQEELEFPEQLVTPEEQKAVNWQMPRLVNDLAYFSEQSKLPAFVVVKDVVLELVGARPLVYKYVE